MKKVCRLKNLGCANCAAKMERAIGKLDGVETVQISFMTQKLVIEAEEMIMGEILQKAQKCISKIEPDCQIIGV